MWIRDPKDFTLDEKLDEIRRAGYEGVELMESLDELGSPEYLRKTLDEHGLALASILVRVGRGDRNVIKESKKRIEYAANFDIESIVVCETWFESGMKPQECHFEILGEELEELSQYASKFNLQIAYHTHVGRRIATMDEIDKLFQFTKSTKLCLDTANVVAAGIDPIHMLNKYKEKIIYVQLKDWKKDKGKEFWDQCVELGEGDLKDVFPKFLSRLDEINYQKWIIVELDHSTLTPFESAKNSREYLRRLGY
jgi:inosose dehydratase